MQNNALRIINFSNIRESAKPLLKKFQILNVLNMCKLEIDKLLYLYENGQMPQRFIKLFTKTSNIHEYNTRQAINSGLFIPTIISELGKKTIKYRGNKLWNSTPHLLKRKAVNAFIQKRLSCSF